jgi:hypothetical protein
MIIITRAQAREANLKTYFTGKACGRDHISNRFTASGNCTKCQTLDVNGKRKAWAKLNPDRMLQATRRHREKDPELVCSKRRAAYAADPKRHINYARKYQQLHPGRVNAANARRRAAILNATPAWLTDQEHAKIRDIYIDASSRQGDWQVDHIVPLRGKTVCGLHIPSNLQILSGPDNRSKGASLVPNLLEQAA